MPLRRKYVLNSSIFSSSCFFEVVPNTARIKSLVPLGKLVGFGYLDGNPLIRLFSPIIRTTEHTNSSNLGSFDILIADKYPSFNSSKELFLLLNILVICSNRLECLIISAYRLLLSPNPFFSL